MDTSNHLGRFIKDCRASLGYTSRKIEELTRARPGLKPISHSNLLAMEKGTYIPTFDKILTLAAVFNVPTQQFEDRLRKDMLGTQGARGSATYDALLEAATRARDDGHPAQALELYTHALAAALAETPEGATEATARNTRAAQARLQAANCRMRLGLLRVAKEDLEEVLADESVPSGIVARASFVTCEIYRQLRNYRLALLHARSALDLSEAAADTVLRAKTLNLLANVLDDRGQSREAVTYYREALGVFEGLDDVKGTGLLCRNLGTTLFRLGDHVEARHFLERGLDLAREQQDRRGEASGLVNLARTYFIGGDLAKARALARDAKEIAQSESYPDVLFAAVFHLWRVAESEGQSPLSHVYADRLTALASKLEGRSEESDEWARHVAAKRRSRA